MENFVELIKQYIESEDKVRLAESRRLKKKIMELETKLYNAETAASAAIEAKSRSDKNLIKANQMAILFGTCFVVLLCLQLS